MKIIKYDINNHEKKYWLKKISLSALSYSKYLTTYFMIITWTELEKRHKIISFHISAEPFQVPPSTFVNTIWGILYIIYTYLNISLISKEKQNMDL